MASSEPQNGGKVCLTPEGVAARHAGDDGCLEEGEVGEVVIATVGDRPFLIRGPEMKMVWYRREHVCAAHGGAELTSRRSKKSPTEEQQQLPRQQLQHPQPTAPTTPAAPLTRGDRVVLAPAGLAARHAGDDGCLEEGEVGEVVIATVGDRPFLIRGPEMKMVWYRREHVVAAGAADAVTTRRARFEEERAGPHSARSSGASGGGGGGGGSIATAEDPSEGAAPAPAPEAAPAPPHQRRVSISEVREPPAGTGHTHPAVGAQSRERRPSFVSLRKGAGAAAAAAAETPTAAAAAAAASASTSAPAPPHAPPEGRTTSAASVTTPLTPASAAAEEQPPPGAHPSLLEEPPHHRHRLRRRSSALSTASSGGGSAEGAAAVAAAAATAQQQQQQRRRRRLLEAKSRYDVRLRRHAAETERRALPVAQTKARFRALAHADFLRARGRMRTERAAVRDAKRRAREALRTAASAQGGGAAAAAASSSSSSSSSSAAATAAALRRALSGLRAHEAELGREEAALLEDHATNTELCALSAEEAASLRHHEATEARRERQQQQQKGGGRRQRTEGSSAATRLRRRPQPSYLRTLKAALVNLYEGAASVTCVPEAEEGAAADGDAGEDEDVDDAFYYWDLLRGRTRDVVASVLRVVAAAQGGAVRAEALLLVVAAAAQAALAAGAMRLSDAAAAGEGDGGAGAGFFRSAARLHEQRLRRRPDGGRSAAARAQLRRSQALSHAVARYAGVPDAAAAAVAARLLPHLAAAAAVGAAVAAAATGAVAGLAVDEAAEERAAAAAAAAAAAEEEASPPPLPRRESMASSRRSSAASATFEIASSDEDEAAAAAGVEEEEEDDDDEEEAEWSSAESSDVSDFSLADGVEEGLGGSGAGRLRSRKPSPDRYHRADAFHLSPSQPRSYQIRVVPLVGHSLRGGGGCRRQRRPKTLAERRAEEASCERRDAVLAAQPAMPVMSSVSPVAWLRHRAKDPFGADGGSCSVVHTGAWKTARKKGLGRRVRKSSGGGGGSGFSDAELTEL